MKHKKVRFTVLLLLCMGITGLFAQQQQSVSVNAAGGDATGTGGSASYSVGQVFYTVTTGSNDTSYQGIQIPYEVYVTGIDQYPNISLSMMVFPNPTQSIVNLKIESQNFENLTFQLYDISGKLLLSQRIRGALTEVPMQTLASGAYLLKVSDTEKQLKTFTIIKNN